MLYQIFFVHLYDTVHVETKKRGDKPHQSLLIKIMTHSKYDQVVEAFRQLIEAKETPTQDKIKAIILEKTGVKMSNSTVSKHLQTLRASNPDEFLKVAQSSEDDPIPADLMPAVTRAVNHIRRTVEVSYSTVQVERLEAELEQLRERVVDAEAVRAELAGLKYAYSTQLERTEALIRENEGLKVGITPEQQPVVDELKVKLSNAHALNKQLTAEVERLKLEAQNLANDASVLTSRLEKSDSERRALQQRNQELSLALNQHESLLSELASAQQTIESLTKQLGAKGSQMTTIGDEVFYVEPVLASAIASERQGLLSLIEQFKNEGQSMNCAIDSTRTEKELMDAQVLTRRQVMKWIKQIGDHVQGKDGLTWEFVSRNPKTYKLVN